MEKLLAFLVCVLVLETAGLFYYATTIPESVAVVALEKQGFSDVTVSHKWLPFVAQFKGCGLDDLMGFYADATNPKGDKVKDIIVCTGTFKGTSILF